MRSLEELERLWAELDDIAVSEDGEYLDEPFQGFPAGTPKEDVWHWFEEQNPAFSVAMASGVAS